MTPTLSANNNTVTSQGGHMNKRLPLRCIAIHNIKLNTYVGLTPFAV